MTPNTTVCASQTGASAADVAAALEASAGDLAAAQVSGPRARPRALPADPDRLAPGSLASYAVSLLQARPAPRPKKPTTKTTTTTSLPAELSFLKDPGMSVQEKVFRLLLYFQQKYDKEVEAKMAAYTGKTKTTTTTSSTGRSAAKSMFAKAFGVMKTLVPGLAALENPAVAKLVKQLSGPVLAAAVTAIGHPELAPIVAKFAPQVLSALADGAQEQGARSDVSAPASSSGSSSSSSSSSSTSEADEKKLAAELQWAMERQQAMTAMLSAVLKTMHETNMDVIHNIR